jgi:proton glutamate symport protein
MSFPLIATSIITGVAGAGNTGSLGKMGLKTFVYYVATSLFAILTGLLLVNLIRPGADAALMLQETPQGLTENVQTFSDVLLRLIPSNPVASMAQGDILPVIFFCLLFGIFLTHLDEPGRGTVPLVFQSLFKVMMLLTQSIIRLAPLGVFALMAKVVGTTGFTAFRSLGLYMLCVGIGLVIHACLTLPLILRLVGGLSPARHVRAMAAALMTAFSTSSSSATLPVTMECAEKNAGVSNRVASFVLPLGATVNMNGTALYECVAALFISQVYGITLSFGQQAIVVLTALLASIGAAGVPMAGLVMMGVILNAVGLPLEGVGLILAVDRVLDMMRTTVNVWGDAVGAVVIASSEGERSLLLTGGAAPDGAAPRL